MTQQFQRLRLTWKTHPGQDILKKIFEADFPSLQESDQLTIEKANGNAFFGFDEEKIMFPPTYRFKRGERNMYIWTKVKRTGNRLNVPSWCDRVLWKSFPEVFIANTAYGCTEDICSSDHSPVFATFEVGMILQSIIDPSCARQHLSNNDVKINFQVIQAKIRTSCQTKFIITYHSTSLEGVRTSEPNSTLNWRSRSDHMFRDTPCDEDEKLYSYPGWCNSELPILVPALSNQSYLEDQHLLLAVKGEDGHESYGECVLSFKRFLTNKVEEFVCCLTHLGEETGEIRGRVKVQLPSQIERHSSLYRQDISDLISTGDLGATDDEPDGMRERFDSSSEPIHGLVMIPNGRPKISQRHATLPNTLRSGFVSQDRYEELEFSEKPSDGRRSSSPDVPALPPKKRLSSSSSVPVLIPTPAAPDCIWISDSRENVSHSDYYSESSYENGSLYQNLKASSCPETGLASSFPLRSSEVATHDKAQSSVVPASKPKPRTKRSFSRGIPKTVEEWLQRLELSQYLEQLIDNGWDDIEFLNDIEDSDLLDAGICNPEHRNKLLNSAKSLKGQKEKLEAMQEEP